MQEPTKQFYMKNHGSIPLDSNFDFKFIVVWTGCSSTSLWLLVTIRKDCVNHKPSYISAIFFCHSSWDFFNFLLLHPTPWLTIKDYSPYNHYPFTAYFYIQRYSKDHDMWLKLIRRCFQDWNQGALCFAAKTLWESVIVTHYNWLFTHWWAKKIIFKKDVFVNSSCESESQN